MFKGFRILFRSLGKNSNIIIIALINIECYNKFLLIINV